MKSVRIFAPLLMAVLSGSPALAQMADTGLTSAQVAARCQYTPKDSACAGPDHPGSQTNGEVILAQRRMPGPPLGLRRPMGGPGPGYPPQYWGPGSGNHAAIGAVIGFGLGAAAGATAKTDARGRVVASLLGGSLCALMGAAIGHGIPSFHSSWRRRSYPIDPGPNDDPADDEEASRRRVAHPSGTKQADTSGSDSAVLASELHNAEIPVLSARSGAFTGFREQAETP
jgi:hypothetical protein